MSFILNKRILRLSRKELEASKQRLLWSKKRIQDYQFQKLKSMLCYAKLHSPWYKDKLSHVEIGKITPESMQIVPILSKKELMENWDQIITDPSLSLSDVLEIIESGDDKQFPFQIVRSGGTSGQPGVYIYDQNSWISSFNTIIRFFSKETFASSMHENQICRVTIAAPFSNHMTSNLMQHSKSQVNDIYIPVTMPFDKIIETLNSHNPDVLQGYPSILSKLAYSQQQSEINIAPRIIISMAETMSNSVRRLLNEVWGLKYMMPGHVVKLVPWV